MEKKYQVQNQNQNTQVQNQNFLSAPQQLMVNIANSYCELFDGKGYEKNEAKKYALQFADALAGVRTKTGAPAYQMCSPDSIRETFFKVLDNKIDLSKKQGALIAYGNKLTLQLEYFGNVKLAKDQVPNLIDIRGMVVYKGDKVITEVKDGMYVIKEHQTAFENMSDENIVGAYSIAIYKNADGTERKGETEIMNANELKQAWLQSSNGTAVHGKFGHEMARKTVESRNAKHLLNKLATFTYEDEPMENQENIIDVKTVVNEEYAMPKVEPTPTPQPTYVEPTIEEPTQPQVAEEETPTPTLEETGPMTSVPSMSDLFNNANNNNFNFNKPSYNNQPQQEPQENASADGEITMKYSEYMNSTYKSSGEYKTKHYDPTTKTITIVKK